MFYKAISYCLLVLTLMACTKPSGPEGALRSFIDMRLNNKITRADIEDIFTGELLEQYQAVEEVEFNDFADMSQYKKKNVKVLSKSCSADLCHITYTLTYGVYENGSEKYESTVKKIADLKKVDDLWKIKSVKNVKTYHQSDKPIELAE